MLNWCPTAPPYVVYDFLVKQAPATFFKLTKMYNNVSFERQIRQQKIEHKGTPSFSIGHMLFFILQQKSSIILSSTLYKPVSVLISIRIHWAERIRRFFYWNELYNFKLHSFIPKERFHFIKNARLMLQLCISKILIER